MAKESTPAKVRGRGIWSAIRETVLVVLVALLLATLVRAFLVQAFVIPSSSMEDTLLVGDRVLVSKLTTRFGEIERGDVVVFTDPGGWLGPLPPGPDGIRGTLADGLRFVGVLPDDSRGHLIKRVIAVGGDRVACCDRQGRLTVNGTPVEETDLLKPGVRASERDFSEKVPAARIWVMGDNRPNSGDSRIHGPVPLDEVVGRAAAVVWPVGRWDVLEREDRYTEAAETAGAAP